MIALIAAIAANNCIGKNNSIPWHLPDDLKHFKALTVHKVVVMGRKTWESLPEKFRPLPERKNVVITRRSDLVFPPEVAAYQTPEAALENYKNEDVFIIGGAEMYAQTIDRADMLYITHVHRQVDGDAFFPVIDPLKWREVEREDHESFSFVTYQKVV